MVIKGAGIFEWYLTTSRISNILVIFSNRNNLIYRMIDSNEFSNYATGSIKYSKGMHAKRSKIRRLCT